MFLSVELVFVDVDFNIQQLNSLIRRFKSQLQFISIELSVKNVEKFLKVLLSKIHTTAIINKSRPQLNPGFKIITKTIIVTKKVSHNESKKYGS